MNSILVVDIGNTSTSIGYCRKGKVSGVGRCKSRFKSLDDVLPLITVKRVVAVVIASVVPPVNARWKKACKAAGLPVPLFVSHKLELGVPVDYPKPEKIGADRLANAAASAKLFGTPSVVCDFGTALTFDVIDGTRGYIGGIICPGLPLMFDYLAEKTALLPHVAPSKTKAVVGRSTKQAMQIGARLGYRGMVREILQSLEMDFGVEKLPVCCTGGYAGWIFKDWDVEAVIDPKLTLKGLGIIGELNC
ncbi:type III pantothenate kinase [Pontiella sulfatireligans]|uniref:Type III pantothenate kinase n=1 Tax=Pontiella sulfatireligans TaxID=2750658 RepID=A0A6C2UDZ5_9BACT|nr:type III pantothenate kinase [Pontiella sulfatireligans]VGO18119.1 Type III pantothenate kinase [Pontiella sulfatireligans]